MEDTWQNAQQLQKASIYRGFPKVLPYSREIKFCFMLGMEDFMWYKALISQNKSK